MKTDAAQNLILIVDDSAASLGLSANTLAKFGFRSMTARSGQEALQLLGDQTPDIILLDIIMQGWDGFETCRRLKQDKRTQDIPVIFMTALSATLEKVKGFSLGAVDYITKPFQKEELAARINTHLTIRRQKEEIERQKDELEIALAKVKTLSGLLPICASCKKIRNDDGYWEQIEVYVKEHSDAEFSHGICPDCGKKIWGKYYKEK